MSTDPSSVLTLVRVVHLQNLLLAVGLGVGVWVAILGLERMALGLAGAAPGHRLAIRRVETLLSFVLYFIGFAGNTNADDDFVVTNGGTSPHWTQGPRDTDNNYQSLNVSRKIVHANANYGSGGYTWTPLPGKFKINIPPTTKAGGTTYQSTYTLTLLTGP